MKALFTFLIGCLITYSCHAQVYSNIPNSVIRGNDTIKCTKAVSYRTFGFITLKYITASGEKVKLTGNKNFKVVTGYTSEYMVYDLIPQNPQKPDKKNIYMQRVVDGPIRIHEMTVTGTSQSITGRSTDMNTNTTTTTYTTRSTSSTFGYFTMPDGKCYKANRTNLKNILVPYLMKCEGVRNNFEDNTIITYKFWNAKKMASYYNLHCEEQ